MPGELPKEKRSSRIKPVSVIRWHSLCQRRGKVNKRLRPEGPTSCRSFRPRDSYPTSVSGSYACGAIEMTAPEVAKHPSAAADDTDRIIFHISFDISHLSFELDALRATIIISKSFINSKTPVVTGG